jgi:hypothetical protein
MKIYDSFTYFHSQIKNRQAGSDQEGGGFATLDKTTLMLRIQNNTQIHDTHHTDIQLKTPNIMTLRITIFSTMTLALSVIMLRVAFHIFTTHVVVLRVVKPPLPAPSLSAIF